MIESDFSLTIKLGTGKIYLLLFFELSIIHIANRNFLDKGCMSNRMPRLLLIGIIMN